MGGSGANPLPRDLSVLTPRERQVYRWACDEWAAGRPPFLSRLATTLGVSEDYLGRLRHRIIRKVGWPCPLKRSTGIHGLGPLERAILLTAIALWEDAHEYPSLSAICLIHSASGKKLSMKTAYLARKKCVSKGIWPCKVRQPGAALTLPQKETIVRLRKSGMMCSEIPSEFRRTHGRSLCHVSLFRVLRQAGLVAPRRSTSILASVETRKAQVIEERGGLAPTKLQDPAAYRRACRRPARPGTSSSRQVPS